MAISSLGGLVMLPSVWAGSYSAVTLDVANDARADIFVAARTGTIVAVQVVTGTVSGTTKAVRVGLQALDANGVPSGTWLGSGNAYGTIAAPATNTIYEVPLGTSVSVTAGTPYAVVTKWDNDADPGTIAFQRSNGFLWPPGGASYGLSSNYNAEQLLGSGTWTKTAQTPVVGIKYDDGFWPMHIAPPVAVATTTFALTTASNPDEVGNRFRLPFSARIVGAWIYADFDYDLDVVLYPDSGAALRSVTMLSANRQFGTNVYGFALFADGPYTLAANTWYRLAYKARHASQATTITSGQAYSAASWAQQGLADCYQCVRQDAGSWTDTDTKRVVMSLLLDGFDTGGSTGGGRPEMRGSNL